jgi:hypothetical protein
VEGNRLHFGGIKLHWRISRVFGSYSLAVIGSCLGVYVVLAVAFHWFVAPTVAKSQTTAPTATMVHYQDAALAALVQSEPQSRATVTPTTATVAAEGPESTGTVAAVPKKKPKKAARRSVRQERPARDFWNPWNFSFR